MISGKLSFLRSNKDLFILAGLGLVVTVIYYQTTSFSFVNLDDNLYVYGNEAVRNGLNLDTVNWAFSSFWAGNWHPLTWFSHALDVQIFGLNAGGHHAVNVLFHLVNSILAFLVFRKMTGREWESLIVALLFAVHPAHVESVAWVAERKDVLSTMFWLLTMWSYTRWVRSDDKAIAELPGSTAYLARGAFSSPAYWVTVALFVLGSMAKPMLVTLPFALVLCDYWPLKRLRSARDILPLIVEKAPMILVSAASSYITFIAQRSVGAVQSIDALSFTTRFENAVVSYAKYIVMLFYPADLAVLYPLDGNLLGTQLAGSTILLASVTILCIWQIRRRPFLLVGWLWFLGTLVPVIGLVQVGSQALADRYTYVPYFGLFLMIVWGVSSLISRPFDRYVALISLLAALATFTVLSWRQTSHWKNNETLYTHALSVTPSNWLISLNYCHYLVMIDRLDDAAPLCRQAIDANPTNAEAYNTTGVLLFKKHQFEDAEHSFKESIKYSPRYVFAWVNLAQSQTMLGRTQDAEESLRTAVEANNGQPSDAFSAALQDLASMYALQQNYEKSAENYRRLIYLRPNDALAHAGYAKTLLFQRQLDDAQNEAQTSVRLQPDLAEGWNILGLIMLERNQKKDAIDYFSKALQIKPDLSEAKENLARAQQDR